MESAVEYLALLPAAVMVFGSVLPYIPQVLKMRQEKKSDGFSPFVCLVLLVANILRVCFFYGKRFGLELLFQSLVMIAAQMLMLRIWFTLRAPSRKPSSFWNWDSFMNYIVSVVGFSIISGVITYFLSVYPAYVETIGFFSLAIESLLGAPQAISNFQRKSTEGMSLGMIGGWFLGDGFKTIWFIINGEPMQFLMCGIAQLTVDVIILVQVFLYKK